MLIDALILAGGRSSRLDSVQKATLRYRNQTLLDLAISAVTECRFVVVVGGAAGELTSRSVLATREDPEFGGPAAAVDAGLKTLLQSAGVVSEFTAVLACDVPRIGAAVSLLIASLAEAGEDGVIAITAEGRLQPLLALYRTASLVTALARLRDETSVTGASMFRLIRGFALREVVVPNEVADDIDTWSDAHRWGIADPRTNFHGQ